MMSKELAKEFITFCCVGVFNSGVSATSLILLSEFTNFHYLLVNMMAHGFTLCVAFTLHKFITFRLRPQRDARIQFLHFVAVFGTAYLAQLVWVTSAIEVLDVYKTYAQVSGVAIMGTMSFLGNRFITFK